MPKGRVFKWFTHLRISQALADNSQLTFNLLDDMSVADMEGSTVTRQLIDFWVRNDTTNYQKVMDWGIVWVDQDAASAGAFPDADDEDERVDWLSRGRMVKMIDTTTGNGKLLEHKHVDSRSQRVCRSENDQLTLILNSDTNGTGGLFVTYSVRTLMRMP